jgi:hypothetical protein
LFSEPLGDWGQLVPGLGDRGLQVRDRGDQGSGSALRVVDVEAPVGEGAPVQEEPGGELPVGEAVAVLEGEDLGALFGGVSRPEAGRDAGEPGVEDGQPLGVAGAEEGVSVERALVEAAEGVCGDCLGAGVGEGAEEAADARAEEVVGEAADGRSGPGPRASRAAGCWGAGTAARAGLWGSPGSA